LYALLTKYKLSKIPTSPFSSGFTSGNTAQKITQTTDIQINTQFSDNKPVF